MAASLGVLTLDLVAKIGNFVQPLNQAENKVKATFNNIRESANQYGPAVLGAASAAAAGLAALTLEAVNSATEIQRIATVAGVTSSQLQYMAVGAKELGIEQDKLGDILADVREKMGEYVSTEGGGMADFFEQIAPKIGVTAEQFAKLSGAEGLQLYASSLEKAGVSQERMRFYMESFASDSTMLLPLLLNNGAGFKIFGDEAERVGGILSNDVLNQTNQLRAGQFLLEQQVKGLKNELVTGTLPVLVDLADAFSNSAGDGTRLVGISDLVNVTLRSVAATALGAAAAVNLFGKTLATAATGAKSAWDGFDLKRLLFSPAGLKDTFLLGSTNFAVGAKEGMSDIRATIDAEATRINKAWGNVDTKSKLDDLASFYGKLAELQKNNGDIGAIGSKAAAEAQNDANKALADQNALLEKQTNLRKQISTMYAPALEQNRFSYADAKNDILGAGFDTKDQEKYLGLAKQFYQRIDDEYLKSLNLELMEFTATEQRKLDVAYGFDKKILANRTDLLDTEKEARKEALDAAYNYQSQQIDLQNRKEILAVQEGYISQSEFVRQRYALEREEITKTIGKSDELKQKLIEASLFKESLERQAARNALGSAQTNAAIGKYQRDDPNGYAQFDLQNQYEGASGSLFNTYGDAKDAINNDPELEQKERDQALLDAHQQYLDAKAAMDDEYNQRNRELLISNQAETLGAYGSIFGDLSDLTKAYGGEQSKAFMLMSAAQKAFTLTSVLLSSADAIGKAWASAPFPANLGAVAIATAKTGALKAMVSAISPVGQAHDGIMEVPDSGTWNLQRGERVLPQKTAANLDRTLNQVKAGSGSGVNITINHDPSLRATARDDGQGNITIDLVRAEVAKGVKASWGNMSNPNSFESKQVQRNTTATRVR